jgi:hypothetical protein
MKYTLQESPSRLRFILTALAMLGAIWATTDLHQHKSGFHAPAQCSVCLLEESVTNGFTPQTGTQLIPQLIISAATVWQICYALAACTRVVSIRAPPFA